MLKIFDEKHDAAGYIIKYKDDKVESDIATGDKTLSFTYLARHHNIRNEFYVQTQEDEYVVKEISESSDGFPQFVCALNLEGLMRRSWESYAATDATIEEAVQPLLEGTGWTVGECGITKRRNAAMIQVTTLAAVRNLCTAFICEPVFDTINKTVSFYEERGEDRGVYLLQGLNLRKLNKKSDSYDYYTQIIPIGAEGLTIENVNGGKKYLENYQYSTKVLSYIWRDDSYTDAQALKEDAELKLKDLSRPAVSYAADVIDLAAQRPEYSILSYKLGDRVTLIDRNTGTMDKQRIVRMVEYPQNPQKNTCELANTMLTFEELQERLQAAADIVNYSLTSDGKIHVSDILGWEKGIEDSVAVGEIKDQLSGVVAVSYDDVAPADAKAGDVWFDTQNGNKPNQYDGEEWQEEPFGSGALEDKSVTEPKISENAVSAEKIQTDAVTAEKIKAGAITADKIQAEAVTAEKIKAGSITADRINVSDLFAQDITASGTIRGAQLVGNTISGGTISGTAVSGGTVSGATVTGGTVSGATISGSTIQSKEGYDSVTITKGTISVEYTIPSGYYYTTIASGALTVSNGVEYTMLDYSGVQCVSSKGNVTLQNGSVYAKNVYINGSSINSLFASNDHYKHACSDGTSRRAIGCPDSNPIAYIGARTAQNDIRVNTDWGDGKGYTSRSISCPASDIRLKENIADTDVEALPIIEQMRIRQFDWQGKGTHQKIGFVADELEEIDPRLSIGGGYDEDGCMDVKCVDTFYLLGYLTKAVQELGEIVRRQGNEISRLYGIIREAGS